ncbi:hypothetical protein [Gracilimonas sp.]|uniref:hypothetical protein n=1 Tax=Gracilimonas sp. TaxID=1974203 RepID=UPI0032EBB523
MHKVLSLFLLVFLTGCSASEVVTKMDHQSNPDYTAVYIIHADANYTFHMNGKRYQADQEILSEAKAVGESARSGEVFIFHQQPERKRFLFFPGKDRVWYHYKGGELVGKGQYSPTGGGFSKEADLYRQMTGNSNTGRKLFFYFGHEMPSKASFAYHHSQPEHTFNTEVFANDISGFEDKFDLMVLSTCNNGNPLTVERLTGKTEYLVASPRNLHLSYLDTHSLNLLETLSDVSTKSLADSIARHSLERLSEQLQTMVTVGVYEMDVVEEYMGPYADSYANYLGSVQQKSLFTDNADCNTLEIFEGQRIPEKGAKIYFSSTAFGREAGLEHHSAWGCKE